MKFTISRAGYGKPFEGAQQTRKNEQAMNIPNAQQPLNGEKTHPLTPHAIGVLRKLAVEPMPRQEINPGCANRLERGGLVFCRLMPTPYKAGKNEVVYLSITDDGRKRLTDEAHS